MQATSACPCGRDRRTCRERSRQECRASAVRPDPYGERFPEDRRCHDALRGHIRSPASSARHRRGVLARAARINRENESPARTDVQASVRTGVFAPLNFNHSRPTPAGADARIRSPHGVTRASPVDDGLGFDLDQHGRIDQGAYLDHGSHRPDVAKDLAVGAADGLPVARDVQHVDPGAHHVAQ